MTYCVEVTFDFLEGAEVNFERKTWRLRSHYPFSTLRFSPSFLIYRTEILFSL